MDDLQHLRNAFVLEFDRVLGATEETRFYSTSDDATILHEHVEQLRAMPPGIGYEEMLRRLGVTPPNAPPGE